MGHLGLLFCESFSQLSHIDTYSRLFFFEQPFRASLALAWCTPTVQTEWSPLLNHHFEKWQLKRWTVKLIHRRKTMNKTIQRHMWSCRVYHGFTKVRTGSCPFWSLRVGREQHVADSSNHSLYLIKLLNSSDPEGNTLSGMSQTICTSVSSRDSTKMCPYQAVHHLSGPDMFVLTLCAVWCVVCVVCVVWVCGVWCVLVCCSCFVGVCRTHSQDHGIHIHTDVHVGVTLFARFLMKRKTQSRTLTFHDVCFSKPLTFHNVSCFFFSLLFPALFYFRTEKWSLKSRKCLKQLREEKKHETIVECSRLRKADIMESKCSRLRDSW